MTQFKSPRSERLTLMRFDAEPIQFQKHAFSTDDESAIEYLRSEHVRDTHGVFEVGAEAATLQSAPPGTPSVVKAEVDFAAFPFEKREYKRGNEPFVVSFIAENLGKVADDAAAIGKAFIETAFPEKSTSELHVLTRSQASIGVEDDRIKITETDIGPALLSTFRNSHVIVRGASQRGDDVELEAIAAGTPVLTLTDGADAVAILSAALKATENAYGKASSDAAKAAKQLRASSAS